MSHQRIRTITFDFWGTLLFDGPQSDERYRPRRLSEFARILTAAGVAVTNGALERAYQQSGAYLGEIWSQSRDVPVAEHVRAILRSVDADLAERLPADAMAKLVEAYSEPALMVPPMVDRGARAALEVLRSRGYTLAVVSNTMRTPGVALRQVLDRHCLLGCFQHTTFSDEIGIRKPDPEIFAMTLRAIGGEPASALHVGDDAVLDVQGARAAGMRVIQVTDGARGAGRTEAPDGVIRQLSELPDAVAALDS